MATVDIRGATLSASDPAIATNPNPDLAIKAPVRVATTGSNIVLSGLQAIDGVALAAGDRVLVKDQADQTTNGLYNAATGPWTRTIDATNNSQWATGTQVLVTLGAVNGKAIWQLAAVNPITLGTTPMTFAVVTRRVVYLVDQPGADPTGVADSTAALVAAIADAQAHGYNAVNCGFGKFRIDAGGIVLNNITLFAELPPDFGDVNNALDYGATGGCFLLTSTTASPFTLTQGWRIEGLSFYYPNQTGNFPSPTVYPPLFTGTYVAGGLFRNNTVLNAYQFMKFNVGNAVGDLRIEHCRIYAIDTAFWYLQGQPEIVNISDCFFSCGIFQPATTPNAYLQNYTSAGGCFMRIDVAGSGHPSVDGLLLANSLIFGYRYGVRILSGSLNVSQINNNLFDATQTALSVEGAASITNSRWQNNYHASLPLGVALTSSNPTISLSSTSAISNLMITDNDFILSLGPHIFWASLSTQDIKITNNRFFSWGQSTTNNTYFALNITDAGAIGTIGLNKFKSASVAGSFLNGIAIVNAGTVSILGNEFDNCYCPIEFFAGTVTEAIVANNWDTNTGYTYSLVNNLAAGKVISQLNVWANGATLPAGDANLSMSANALALTNNGIGATSTDGFVLKNSAAATVGLSQWSPRLHFSAQTWSGSATETADWIVENQAGSNNKLVFSEQIAGGGYTAIATLSKSGLGVGIAPNYTFHAYTTTGGNPSFLFAGNNGSTINSGLRFGMTAAGVIFEGVDSTGVSSYQPLYVGGSVLLFQTSAATCFQMNSPTSLQLPGYNTAGVLQNDASGNLTSNSASNLAAAIYATDLYSSDAAYLMRTKTSLTDGHAAQTATLTNAPTAGNPTKWIAIDDNGTKRQIPAW